jgi:predicted helicase
VYCLIFLNCTIHHATTAKANKNALSDPYVKAVYWASKRIGDDGIVAFVTNNSFVNEISFDGMRKHLEKDFNAIYILDLGGNVRKNPKLSGTTHNVFGIQIGVSINLLVKKNNLSDEKAKIYYARLDELWKKEQKYEFLSQKVQVENIEWQVLKPDAKHTWLTAGLHKEYDSFLAMGTKDAKAHKGNAIFSNYGRGVATCRDTWVYNFSSSTLSGNIQKTIEVYNEQIDKLSRCNPKPKIDDFVLSDETKISWSEGLKNYLRRLVSIDYNASNLRHAI